ncbi:MAG: LamG-like jellyroll fold domain-containing protein, partial [Verrucomicrobiota bacterium]
DFGGAADAYFRASGVDYGTASFTAQAVIHDTTTGVDDIVTIGDSSNPGGKWIGLRKNGAGTFQLAYDDGTNAEFFSSSNTINDGAWKFLTATFQRGGSASAYSNAVSGGSSSIAGIGDVYGGQDLFIGTRYIGSSPSSANMWQGKIGGVRLRSGILSADQLKLEDNNYRFADQFFTYIDPTVGGGSSVIRLLRLGQWVQGVPYVLNTGAWAQATPHVLSSGTWVQTNDTL